MAFGYRYTLKRQDNGWWLVRFPGIPEALTEGETKEEARANALDCVIAALEGYMKAGRPLSRAGAVHSGPYRTAPPSLVTSLPASSRYSLPGAFGTYVEGAPPTGLLRCAKNLFAPALRGLMAVPRTLVESRGP